MKEVTVGRKLTQKEFEDRVYAQLGDRVDLSKFEYKGANGKGVVICPTHGEYTTSASSLLAGQGCLKCYRDKQANGGMIHSPDAAIARAREIHNNKYEYDVSTYKGNKRPMRMICPEHGEFWKPLEWHTNQKQGCQGCAADALKLRSRQLRKGSDVMIPKFIEKFGDKYDFSKAVFEKSDDLFTVICPEHGEFQITSTGLRVAKYGCQKCATQIVGEKNTTELDDIHRELYEKHGHEYTFGDVIVKGPTCRYIYVTCPKHGTHLKTLRSVQIGYACRQCTKSYMTKPQVEVFEFISQYVDAEMEVKFKDGSRRLHDIFIPSLNLAVEYHGLIWHSSMFLDDVRNDYKRHVAAESFGVRIIHIYQDEWRDQREVVERMLLSAIGALPRTYARKTEVIEVGKDEAVEFFNSNHLQGAPSGGVHLGLIENGELVACMSFSICRSVRGNKNNRFWELNRYAATKTVVGGASKLLKAFLKMNLCDKLISYSDTRLFSGNMYKQLGFMLDGSTAPDYKYMTPCGKSIRMHKSGFKRELLAKKFKDFDPNLSERENCHNNGYYQVFDCGKKRWILNP